MPLKRKIDHWDHYYRIASSRPDLKEFKDVLIINANNPNINLGENNIATQEKETITDEKGKQTIITKTIYKTVNQLIVELAPKNDSQDNNI